MDQAKVGQAEEVPAAFRADAQQRARRPASNVRIQSFASRAEARSAYLRRDIRGYYMVPADFLDTGVVQLEIKKGAFMSNNEPGWNTVRRLVQASLIEGKIEDRPAQR